MACEGCRRRREKMQQASIAAYKALRESRLARILQAREKRAESKIQQQG